jgi:hypothetical protein
MPSFFGSGVPESSASFVLAIDAALARISHDA